MERWGGYLTQGNLVGHHSGFELDGGVDGRAHAGSRQEPPPEVVGVLLPERRRHARRDEDDDRADRPSRQGDYRRTARYRCAALVH